MERERLEKQLLSKVIKTSKRWDLVEPDDRIMVCLSGGKDSYTLLKLLTRLKTRVPFTFELTAVHLDQQQPGYDGRPLVEWLRQSGTRFEILSEDTYSVVTERLTDKQTYCSLCSRLRRGILYTAAERLECNKIALGHHRDDSLETFLMNLFYGGKLQAMPAVYTTNDDRFRVIRPLIDCEEKDIRRFAELEAFPILPCNLCGSQTGLKRDAMTELLAQLEVQNPNVRAIMAHAIQNVRPTHLMDQDILAAWATRAPEIRPDVTPAPRTRHARALPILTEAEGL